MKIDGKKIILEGVVGSHAYGLNHTDSDIDTAGVFVEPTTTILGLFPYKETITRTNGIDKEETPDITYHEVGKFVELCLKANPTVMEQLWLGTYLQSSDEGNYLINAREKFLSQRIRQTYGGYARAQFKRLHERGNFSSTLKKRTFKHARHMMRLLIQGQYALEHGELRLMLTQKEKLESARFAQLAIDDIDKFSIEVEPMFNALDRCETRLPEEPDMNAINEILLKIRKSNP